MTPLSQSSDKVQLGVSANKVGVHGRPLTASLTLHPAHVVLLTEWNGVKCGIANSVAVDDIAAGECARGRPKDYRQAKGGD